MSTKTLVSGTDIRTSSAAKLRLASKRRPAVDGLSSTSAAVRIAPGRSASQFSKSLAASELGTCC